MRGNGAAWEEEEGGKRQKPEPCPSALSPSVPPGVGTPLGRLM